MTVILNVSAVSLSFAFIRRVPVTASHARKLFLMVTGLCNARAFPERRFSHFFECEMDFPCLLLKVTKGEPRARLLPAHLPRIAEESMTAWLLPLTEGRADRA